MRLSSWSSNRYAIDIFGRQRVRVDDEIVHTARVKLECILNVIHQVGLIE